VPRARFELQFELLLLDGRTHIESVMRFGERNSIDY